VANETLASLRLRKIERIRSVAIKAKAHQRKSYNDYITAQRDLAVAIAEHEAKCKQEKAEADAQKSIDKREVRAKSLPDKLSEAVEGLSSTASFEEQRKAINAVIATERSFVANSGT